ncbi:sodium-dependent transporter [Termitidicoccus mucosus]|uniref:Sodium:calcium symporter n=1 Tax=Termitidicoccus mucosus TaxID=1184151 RepID=A0A178II34_9BACT|nr:sodium:calcium symporter [Opitutaceae bacterium TSB47]
MSRPQEAWTSNLGVIFAVAGSAVGLGNFLRFPGLAAQYGGGAFMIAYFVSLLVIGVPVCWAEWTVGRHGGHHGYHSSPGIFHALLRRRWAKYFGSIGFLIPMLVCMYYVYVEAWCLGYAVNAISGRLSVPGMHYGEFFATYTGANVDGVAVKFGLGDVGIFVVIVLLLNLYLLYRGLSKGIELACRVGMPLLVGLGLILLVRVLTLGTPDPARPGQNVLTALGFMWNPGDSVLASLRNPQLWLAAAGQVFFSLSIGLGVIITYASYLRKTDDVTLSGLTAVSANEFCEVALGGMITVPAAFIFLGAAGVAGQGTFALGFIVLPEVFAHMPAGVLFASAFFVLLFLAAVTSSLSILQPVIAFLEEAFAMRRAVSVSWLALVMILGTGFVWYFSKDLKALDTIDFWIGNVGVFLQGTVIILLFGWVIGIEKSWREMHRGAALRVPGFFRIVMRYITPLYLITIFTLFLLDKVVGWNFSFEKPVFQQTGYIADLVGNAPSPVARITVGFIIAVCLLGLALVTVAGRRWRSKPVAPHYRK